MSPVVVLVGPPGAGKTTVGLLVSARLAVPFTDTDRVVEADTGSTVADLFVQRGEPFFRELERAAVARACATAHGVLALGAGAVMDPGTRALLADVPVAFLDVGPATAADRVGMERSRPLLLGNIRGQLRRMLADRHPLYEEVADVVVDTDGLDPGEVADRVVAGLSAPGPG